MMDFPSTNMTPNSSPATTFFHVKDLGAFLRDLYRHGVGYVAQDGTEFPEGLGNEFGVFATAYLTIREDGAIQMTFKDELRIPTLEHEYLSDFEPERLVDADGEEIDRPFHADIEALFAEHIVEGEFGVLTDPMDFHVVAFAPGKVRSIDLNVLAVDEAARVMGLEG